MIDRNHLSIYLNDHLAGSTAGLELARRARGAEEGTPVGELFARLAEELEAERETLKAIIDHLGFDADRVKVTGGWLAEKAGRLKLNGQLLERSPLSTLTELEGIHVGISGKISLWENLRAALGERLARFDLDGLLEQAQRQRSEVEELRLEVAREVLGAAAAEA